MVANNEEDVGYYTPETAKLILDVVRYLRANDFLIKGGHKKELIGDAPRIHIAYTSETITARDEEDCGIGKAVLQQVFGVSGTAVTLSDFPVTPPAEIDVYSLRSEPIQEGQYIHVIREFASGKWFVVPDAENKVRIKAVITGANDFEEANSAPPYSVTSIEGINKAYDGDPGIQLYNPLILKVWDGCIVLAEYNVTTEHWEIYAAQGDKIVHGIKRDTEACVFEKLDAANGWNAWDYNATYNWVTSIYLSGGGCELLYDTECQLSLSAGELEFIKDVTFDGCDLVVSRCDADETYPMPFVTEVRANATEIYYVTCTGAETVIDLTECPT